MQFLSLHYKGFHNNEEKIFLLNLLREVPAIFETNNNFQYPLIGGGGICVYV